MIKETIICIAIVVTITTGNILTQNHTKEVVRKMNGNLDEIRNQILEVSESVDEEKETKVKIKIDEIKNDWYKHKQRLAYYIEHDEIEKIDKAIVILKINIDMSDYEQAMENLEDAKFILQHIQYKYAFTLQNIF